MTIPELVRFHGVSRQTIHTWIKLGHLVPEGPQRRNRRGKPSRTYRLVNELISPKVPKWKLFEMNCLAAGRSPAKVLGLLLSRCQSQGHGNDISPYGDPDFFAAALFLAIHRGRHFLDHLFEARFTTTCPEAEVAALVQGRPNKIHRFRKKHFRQAWAAAKEHVFKALGDGDWRYNCNPYINAGARLVMIPRWANKLSHETIYFLREKGLLYSTNTHEAFIRYPGWKKCLIKVGALWNDPSTREATRVALRQFRSLSFKGNRAIFDGKSQQEALQWLREQLAPNEGYAIKFAEVWARRYQRRVLDRPTRQLVNAIFYTRGRLPTPISPLIPSISNKRQKQTRPNRRYGQYGLPDHDAYEDNYDAYENDAQDSEVDWNKSFHERIDERLGWDEH